MPLSPVEAPFSFTVRSSADPVLELETLTDGTQFFGLTPHEQRLTGGVCVVLGLLLLASPLIWLYCRWQRCRDEAKKAETEPLAFASVSAGGGGDHHIHSVDVDMTSGPPLRQRQRRAPARVGTRDVPVLGEGSVGGDAYIEALVRQQRHEEDTANATATEVR